MNYYLLRLCFDSAVHFGAADASSLAESEGTLCADTLFSALCHTALQLEGNSGIARLIDMARDGELLLSDAFPWQKEHYFLPKPCILSSYNTLAPMGLQKALKKLKWISVSDFAAFSVSVQGGEAFSPTVGSASFGTKDRIVRATVTENADTVPYTVGTYCFAENTGLYFLYAVKESAQAQWIEQLFGSLGHSGIGGKVSSGLGRFQIAEAVCLAQSSRPQDAWLYRALTAQTARSLLLTTSLPKQEELEETLDGAYYQMQRRSGFVASQTYAEEPQKKLTQFLLRSGATVTHRFEGDLYPVGQYGVHPVYRYGRPLFLGVSL